MRGYDERRGALPLVVWSAVCVAWLIVVWAWSALHLAMTVDDTYYYFKTAFHVSRGVGSTFDGINPTDGYHPLWLALLAVMFKPLSGDFVLLTRVAFTMQIAMIWLGGVWLARLREAGGPKLLWALALVIANPFAAKIVLCGQETALQFMLSSAALVLWWSMRGASDGDSPKRWAALGLVCSLAALARLDNVFFCAALLAMPVVLPSDRERAAGLAARIKASAIGMAVFAAGLGAFLVYHFVTFHHLMPVSGAIKEHLDADEVAPIAARAAAGALALAGIAGIWLAARRWKSPVFVLLAPPVAAASAVAIYNFGLRGEMSPQLVRIWYLEPYLLVGVLAIGAVLGTVQPRPRWLTNVLAIGIGVWAAGCLFSWRYRVDQRSYNLYEAATRCSTWVETHDVGAIGAAWDAGFAAAFTQKPVMNLDGLINSWAYKDYLDQGTVDDFVTRVRKVDFVIQYAWPRRLRSIAKRFEHEAVPAAPVPQTTVSGDHDRQSLASRWGIDLAPFYVAHVECVPVSVATNPTKVVDAVFYFVLTREPRFGHMTLAEFARANKDRDSCDGFKSE